MVSSELKLVAFGGYGGSGEGHDPCVEKENVDLGDSGRIEELVCAFADGVGRGKVHDAGVDGYGGVDGVQLGAEGCN